MPDKPQQSTETKRVGLSIDEAVSRLHAKRSEAQTDAPTDDADEQSAAPTAEQQPNGLDPDETNLDEESNAGEADDESAADEADDASDDDQDAKDPIYTVTVDGEEHQVTLKELIEGFQFEASTRRKSQALAEERRAVEGKAKEIQERAATLAQREQRLEQYDAALEALQTVLKDADDKWAEVDWDQRYEDDPHEAAKEWLRYQRHKERKTEADAEAKRRADEKRQEAEVKRKERIASFQAEMAKAFPKWTDQSVMTKDLADMQKTARALGFTDAEFQTTTDARIFRLLDKAIQLDRIEAAKAAAKTAAPKPAKEPNRVVHPGGARPAVRAGAKSLNDALSNLAKSRSIGAAEQALRAFRSARARG